MPNVSVIPAGSRLLAEDLLEWRTGINARLEGTTAYKTATTSRTSTTTYADDPHLAGISVVANGVYVVEFNAVVTVGAGGFKQQFTFPSGTVENVSFDYNNGTVTYANAWQAIGAGASPGAAVTGVTAGTAPWRVMFTLFVGGTGGSLALQWAQNSSNAAATSIAKGAWVRTVRVA